MGMSKRDVSVDLPADARDFELYKMLAARHSQRGALVWQVPTLSFTGQAFLLTVALSHENSRLSRCFAASLGFVVAVMSIELMARHRRAARADEKLLNEYEKREGVGIHGDAWRKTRNEMSSVLLIFGKLPGMETWMGCFLLFAGVNLAIFVLALIAPEVF
jgi:hypothetical protein